MTDSKSSKRERGLIQNPARERDEVFKIHQERETRYSKASKRERMSYSKSSKRSGSEFVVDNVGSSVKR